MFSIGLCLFAIVLHVSGECSGGCNEPTSHYEDLNCKPVYSSTDDCCPSHYDCSHIEEHARTNEKNCIFHGKTYGSGESINDDEIYGNCMVGCTCRSKPSGNMGFTCAILDCPEWLGQRPNYGCHFKYELDKCCKVGQVCGPYSITCEVGGKKYLEGQQFDAPNLKCTNCVCKEGFQGKFEEPFCKKHSCTQEVRYQEEIKRFCAPSYISKGGCCPFNWICPKDDEIIPAATASKNPELKCKYGNQLLNIGDSFSRTSGTKGKASCECLIPPYLTCTQNYDFTNYSDN